MGASASVSKQDVSALSAEQKKALVAKLEPPYCEKKGVENESLTPLRDEFLQLNDGRPGSKALQDLQKEVVAAVGADELSSALASVRQPTGTSGAPKLAAVSPPKLDAVSPPKLDADDGSRFPSQSPPSKFRQRRLSISDLDRSGDSPFPSASAAAKIELYSAPEIGSAPATMPPFPPHIVGTYSCHGVEPSRDGSSTVCDKINQDRGGVIFPFAGHPRQALFCVFDGHGEYGDVISQTAMHELQARLEVELRSSSNPAKALKKVRASVGPTCRAREECEPFPISFSPCIVVRRYFWTLTSTSARTCNRKPNPRAVQRWWFYSVTPIYGSPTPATAALLSRRLLRTAASRPRTCRATTIRTRQAKKSEYLRAGVMSRRRPSQA